MNPSILIIDDDVDTCEMIALGLKRRDFKTTAVHTADDALRWIADNDAAAVLCDVGLGEDDGIELCRRLLEIRKNLPVVIVTGRDDFETAVRAIRAGAYDFVAKPVKVESLAITLDRCLQLGELRDEVARLRREIDSSRVKGELIGESRVMKSVYDLIAQLAVGDASVLINGESGTGKELVARAIHDASERSGRFIAINCAAMPAALLESELFGHVRGAFTDAKRDREGLFVQAKGGTLFLDEIGEMPLEMQAKLLRVLQERRVRPVGGDAEIDFDTRIVSATNRDLHEEISEGAFREDLFYRINVIAIDVPPLRSRGRDILLLAQAFVERFAERMGKPVAGISAAAAMKLQDYNWPGNVRELENCMERAVTLTKFEEISVEDLPAALQQFKPRSIVIEGDDPEQMPTLTTVEERYLRRVLEAVAWNKSRAARILGVDRRTLYRKMERLKIEDGSQAS